MSIRGSCTQALRLSPAPERRTVECFAVRGPLRREHCMPRPEGKPELTGSQVLAPQTFGGVECDDGPSRLRTPATRILLCATPVPFRTADSGVAGDCARRKGRDASTAAPPCRRKRAGRGGGWRTGGWSARRRVLPRADARDAHPPLRYSGSFSRRRSGGRRRLCASKGERHVDGGPRRWPEAGGPRRWRTGVECATTGRPACRRPRSASSFALRKFLIAPHIRGSQGIVRVERGEARRRRPAPTPAGRDGALVESGRDVMGRWWKAGRT